MSAVIPETQTHTRRAPQQLRRPWLTAPWVKPLPAEEQD
jgi:hypothetical protein